MCTVPGSKDGQRIALCWEGVGGALMCGLGYPHVCVGSSLGEGQTLKKEGKGGKRLCCRNVVWSLESKKATFQPGLPVMTRCICQGSGKERI